MEPITRRVQQKKITLFTDLDAWQLSHQLVLHTYNFSRLFPDEEKFGLTSQMRRSIVSVTSNIAEGFTRQSSKEKLHFYSMAHASLSEWQNQLIVARDVGFVQKDLFDELSPRAISAHKVIAGLIRSIRKASVA